MIIASLRNLVCATLTDRRAAALVEYALLAALIAVVAVTALTSLGGNVSTKFSSVATKV